MKEPVIVPALGESVSKGTLVAWLVQSGAHVQPGDELFELETDKATVRVPATAAGQLSILAREGSEVVIGQQVALIDSEARSTAAAVAPSALPSQPAAPPAAAPPVAARSAVAPPAAAPPIPTSPAAPAAEPERAAESPRKPVPAPAVAPPAAEGAQTQTRVAMSPLRRRTAQRLGEARREAVHVTTFNEIDMRRVMDIRSRCREAFEKKHGTKLGLMSFFVKACSSALRAYPIINAALEGDEIVYHHAHHIGVAVSLDQGLVVPVIRHAERLTFADIERTIADLAERARTKRLMPDELAGGTFSITNGGVFGSMLSTPVPAFPQSAILGMHAIQSRPVAVADAVVIRPMMYTALTYDHRMIDGREAIGFLVKVKALLEDPGLLLLET